MQATLVRLWGLFLVEKTLCIIPIIIVEKKIACLQSSLFLMKKKSTEMQKMPPLYRSALQINVRPGIMSVNLFGKKEEVLQRCEGDITCPASSGKFINNDLIHKQISFRHFAAFLFG